jgi:superfamily II DNA or RNA helicase
VSRRRRSHNDAERLQIYIRADGKCEECRTPLTLKGFHADHVVSFADGGPTTVENARALCPRCNLTKGRQSRPESGAFAPREGIVLNTQEQAASDFAAFADGAWTGSEDNDGAHSDSGDVPPLALPSDAPLPKAPAEWAALYKEVAERVESYYKQNKRDGERYLRRFQRIAMRRFSHATLAQSFRQFFIFGCAGSGKTKLMLAHAHLGLTAGLVDLVVVMAPSTNVRKQFRDAAAAYPYTASAPRGHVSPFAGIEMASTDDIRAWSEMGVPSDVRTLFLTYQSVIRCADELETLCAGRRVALICDETHWVSSDTEVQRWGRAVFGISRACALRIGGSGTPYRTDGAGMGLYMPDEPRCDEEYSVPEAQADGAVCAPIFRLVHGTVEIHERSPSGHEHHIVSRAFSDTGDVPMPHARPSGVPIDAEEFDALDTRVLTMLFPRTTREDDADYIINERTARLLIARAVEELNKLRETHPTAAGMLTVSNQRAAARVTELLRAADREIADGTAWAVQVTSDDAEAARKLERFKNNKNGRGKWVVAISMVTEGVDIPRLKVGVRMSSVSTLRDLVQWIGRFVRVGQGFDASVRPIIFSIAHPRLLLMWSLYASYNAASWRIAQARKLPPLPMPPKGGNDDDGLPPRDPPVPPMPPQDDELPVPSGNDDEDGEDGEDDEQRLPDDDDPDGPIPPPFDGNEPPPSGNDEDGDDQPARYIRVTGLGAESIIDNGWKFSPDAVRAMRDKLLAFARHDEHLTRHIESSDAAGILALMKFRFGELSPEITGYGTRDYGGEREAA